MNEYLVALLSLHLDLDIEVFRQPPPDGSAEGVLTTFCSSWRGEPLNQNIAELIQILQLLVD